MELKQLQNSTEKPPLIYPNEKVPKLPQYFQILGNFKKAVCRSKKNLEEAALLDKYGMLGN